MLPQKYVPFLTGNLVHKMPDQVGLYGLATCHRGLSVECLTGGPRRRQTPACRSSSLVFRSKKVIRSTTHHLHFFCTTSPDSNSLLCQSDCRRLRAVKSPQDCFTNRLRGLSGECLTGDYVDGKNWLNGKTGLFQKRQGAGNAPWGGLSDRIFCFVPIILVSSGTITCPRNYPNSLLRAG